VHEESRVWDAVRCMRAHSGAASRHPLIGTSRNPASTLDPSHHHQQRCCLLLLLLFLPKRAASPMGPSSPLRPWPQPTLGRERGLRDTCLRFCSDACSLISKIWQSAPFSQSLIIINYLLCK